VWEEWYVLMMISRLKEKREELRTVFSRDTVRNAMKEWEHKVL
jgi:hypothetical protein